MNELDDPDAAPLEQNVKNLECDGVIYKVVKEDPTKAPINVSRLTRLFILTMNLVGIADISFTEGAKYEYEALVDSWTGQEREKEEDGGSGGVRLPSRVCWLKLSC